MKDVYALMRYEMPAKEKQAELEKFKSKATQEQLKKINDIEQDIHEFVS